MTDYWKAIAMACSLAKRGHQAAYVVGANGYFAVVAESELPIVAQHLVLVRVGS